MVLWKNFDAGDPQAECQRDHGMAGFVISHAEKSSSPSFIAVPSPGSRPASHRAHAHGRHRRSTPDTEACFASATEYRAMSKATLREAVTILLKMAV